MRERFAGRLDAGVEERPRFDGFVGCVEDSASEAMEMSSSIFDAFFLGGMLFQRQMQMTC